MVVAGTTCLRDQPVVGTEVVDDREDGLPYKGKCDRDGREDCIIWKRRVNGLDVAYLKYNGCVVVLRHKRCCEHCCPRFARSSIGMSGKSINIVIRLSKEEKLLQA